MLPAKWLEHGLDGIWTQTSSFSTPPRQPWSNCISPGLAQSLWAWVWRELGTKTNCSTFLSSVSSPDSGENTPTHQMQGN